MRQHVRPLDRSLKSLARVAPVILILAGWELLTQIGVISTQVLPKFSSVFSAAVELVYSGEVFNHLIVSLYRALGGLALSILIGIALGFGMGTKRQVKNFFDPLVTLNYPLPKTALVPLTMVWLGVTDQAAILVIFLACLLPIVINAYHGVRSVDRVLVWSAKSLGTPERGLFRRIVIPASMPYIFNGIRIALPISFIVVISVELVASKVGIGNLINGFGGLGIYNYMFATILIFVVIAFIADRFTVRLGKRILRWHEEKEAS
jgi:ABC-type nitrate/sulfonate/bicarbonate transport system permease component